MNTGRACSRREFIHFIGGITATVFTHTVAGKNKTDIPFIQASSEDAVILADGLDYQLLVSWGEPINSGGDKFGFNNDYIDYVRIDNNPDDCLFWINHESVSQGYFLTSSEGALKSREDVELERREVGGSIVRISKSNGQWKVNRDDKYNRRIDANTRIPIIADAPIHGETEALGTFANCAGGRTPWNTILSCEENYHYYTGEVSLKGKRTLIREPSVGWDRFYPMVPEHYGWVIEIDPFSGQAKKHTSMGRFAHESATVIVAKDERCVVYSGDDKTNQFLYKFIADEPGSLEKGALYVADTLNGSWLLLDVKTNPKLEGYFRSQLDMLIRTREAGALAGATPLDRPEDIERDPETGSIFVTLTKNKGANRPYGSILKIEETNNDPLSLTFQASTFINGGESTGFACPDNLAFDVAGNLWFTSDISGEQLNYPPYSKFGNNGLFMIPMNGQQSGQVLQLGSAPVHAEFTGIRFSEDGRSLFISVQHPGENSADKNNLLSHWPDGGNSMPKPSVIVIEGDLINRFCV
ncbi:MAG: DUF839 domain-containing protein [Gammaproteobacteria bacterium]|nr:DUF839 domain-containing protein [Gammaproteobacteria bacterium]